MTDDAELQATRVVVRPLTQDDHEAVAHLHRIIFPDLGPWRDDQFRAQVGRFPEGQIGIELDGRLVATSSSLIVQRDEYEGWHTFREVSDGGYIGTHEPDGDALYGIDIAVDPEARGLRLSRRIYNARKQLCRTRNLRSILIAGRMPGYHQYADSMTAEEYVRKAVLKDLEDPVINAQLSNGFSIQAVLPDYLPTDQESRGNALLMEWLNPSYTPPLRRHRRNKVRVAAVQYQMRPVENFDAFVRQCEFYVDTAAEYRCDFVLFPELLTNQLLGLVPADRPGASARNLHRYTEGYIEAFGKMAIRYNVNIVAGTHLTVENETLYNIAYLFHRNGRISKQYKLHITPSEQRWWGVSPGDRLDVFDTDRGKVAIAICYDVEFPELVRMARKKGARLLFVPFNTDIRSGYLRVRSCAQARCIENHMYTVLAGAVGNLPQVEGADIHYAQSAILTPSDVHFARDGVAEDTTPNAECMVMSDLDLELLRRTERTGTVRPWLDRRLDLYRISWHEDDDEVDA